VEAHIVYGVEPLATYIDCPRKYRFRYEDAIVGVRTWRERLEKAVRETLVVAVGDNTMTIEDAHSMVRNRVEAEFLGVDARAHRIAGDPVDAAIMAVSEWFRFHQNRTALEPGAAILSVIEHEGQSISTATSCDWFDGGRPRMYLVALDKIPSKTYLALDPACGLRAIASNCPHAWMVEGYSVSLCRQAVRQVKVSPCTNHLRRCAILAAKRISAGDFELYAHPSLRGVCLDCRYREECGRFSKARRVSRG